MKDNDYSVDDFLNVTDHEDVAKEERHIVRNIMSNISLIDITEEDLDYLEEELERAL